MSAVTFTRKQTQSFTLPDPGFITASMRKAANAEWANYRHAHGFKRVSSPFGTPPTGNYKLAKGESLIFGLSLAPSRMSGINVCPWATPICIACCVAHSGNGNYPAVVRARIAKTRFLFEQPYYAAILLADFLDKAMRKGLKKGKTVGIRLNTFSNLQWQTVAPWLFVRYPSARFYDYTKNWNERSVFPNYWLTYSASEKTTDAEIVRALESGANVAVVFDTPRGKPLPAFYLGSEVIDGDLSDERWLDPSGCVVGLRAKGRMRTAGKGMVYAG